MSLRILDTIFCQWNMSNFGEYTGICHLPLASLTNLESGGMLRYIIYCNNKTANDNTPTDSSNGNAVLLRGIY